MAATSQDISPLVLPNAFALPEPKNIEETQKNCLTFIETTVYNGGKSAKSGADRTAYNAQIAMLIEFAKEQIFPLYFTQGAELKDANDALDYFHSKFKNGLHDNQPEIIVDQFKNGLETILYIAHHEATEDIKNGRTHYLLKRKSDLKAFCNLITECGPGTMAATSDTATSWLLVNSSSTNFQEILVGFKNTIRVEAVQAYNHEHNVKAYLNSHFQNPINTLFENLGFTPKISQNAEQGTEAANSQNNQVHDHYTSSQITPEMTQWCEEYFHKRYNRTAIIDFIVQHFSGLLNEIDKDSPTFLEQARTVLAAFYQLKSVSFNDSDVIDSNTGKPHTHLHRNLRFFCEKLLVEEGFISHHAPLNIFAWLTKNKFIKLNISTRSDTRQAELENFYELLKARFASVQITHKVVNAGVEITFGLINGAPKNELDDFLNELGTEFTLTKPYTAETNQGTILLPRHRHLSISVEKFLTLPGKYLLRDPVGLIEDLAQNTKTRSAILSTSEKNRLLATIKSKSKKSLTLPTWDLYYGLMTLLTLPLEFNFTAALPLIEQLAEENLLSVEQIAALKKAADNSAVKPLNLTVNFTLNGLELTAEIINAGTQQDLQNFAAQIKQQYETQGFTVEIKEQDKQVVVKLNSEKCLKNLAQVMSFCAQQDVSPEILNAFRSPIEAELSSSHSNNQQASSSSQSSITAASESNTNGGPTINVKHTDFGYEISLTYNNTQEEQAEKLIERITSLSSEMAKLIIRKRKVTLPQNKYRMLVTIDVSYDAKQNVLNELLNSSEGKFSLRADDLENLSHELEQRKARTKEESNSAKQKLVEQDKRTLPYLCFDRSKIDDVLSLDVIPDLSLVYYEGLEIERWAINNQDYQLIAKLHDRNLFKASFTIEQWTHVLVACAKEGSIDLFSKLLNIIPESLQLPLNELLAVIYRLEISNQLTQQIRFDLVLTLLNKGASLKDADIDIEKLFNEILNQGQESNSRIIENLYDLPVVDLAKIINNITRLLTNTEAADKLNTNEIKNLITHYYQKHMFECLSKNDIATVIQILLIAYNRKSHYLFGNELLMTLLNAVKEKSPDEQFQAVLLQCAMLLLPLVWQNEDKKTIFEYFSSNLQPSTLREEQVAASSNSTSTYYPSTQTRLLASTITQWIEQATNSVEKSTETLQSQPITTDHETHDEDKGKGKGKGKTRTRNRALNPVPKLRSFNTTPQAQSDEYNNSVDLIALIRSTAGTLEDDELYHLQKDIFKLMPRIISDDMIANPILADNLSNSLLSLAASCQEARKKYSASHDNERNKALNQISCFLARLSLDPTQRLHQLEPNEIKSPSLESLFFSELTKLCQLLVSRKIISAENMPVTLEAMQQLFSRNNNHAYPHLFEKIFNELQITEVMESPLEFELLCQLRSYKHKVIQLAKLSSLVGIPFCIVPGAIHKEDEKRQILSHGVAKLSDIAQGQPWGENLQEQLTQCREMLLPPVPLDELNNYFALSTVEKIQQKFLYAIEGGDGRSDPINKYPNKLIPNYSLVVNRYYSKEKKSQSNQKRRALKDKYEQMDKTFKNITQVFRNENNSNEDIQDILTDQYPHLKLDSADNFSALEYVVREYLARNDNFQNDLNELEQYIYLPNNGKSQKDPSFFRGVSNWLDKLNDNKSSIKPTYADYLMMRETQRLLNEYRSLTNKSYDKNLSALENNAIIFSPENGCYGEIKLRSSNEPFKHKVTQKYINELKNAIADERDKQIFSPFKYFNSSIILPNDLYPTKVEADKDGCDYEYLYKFVLLGDRNSGITCLRTRFTHDEFPKEKIKSVGAEFSTRTIKVHGKNIKSQIWEQQMQDRYRAMCNVSFRGAVGAIVVIDPTNPESLAHAGRYLEEVEQMAASDIEKVFALTKCDLYHDKHTRGDLLDLSEIEAFAKQHGIPVIATSALEREGVEQLFYFLTRKIFDFHCPNAIEVESPAASSSSVKITDAHEQPEDEARDRNACRLM